MAVGTLRTLRVFLSYHSPDHEVARRLADALAAHDPSLDVFFDRYDLRAGAFWVPALSEAIGEADAVIVLLGVCSPGPWQRLEYFEALNRKAKEPQFPIVPVLLQSATPRLPFLYQLHQLRLADPTATGALDPLLAALRGKPPPPSEEPWRTVNPYRGLLVMTDADGDFFFGREQLTVDILEKLRRGERMLTLVGNSGVGKSSLVQAGVVAALRRQLWPGGGRLWPGDLRDSRSWLVLSMKPGEAPVFELARAFVAQWTEPTDPARERLAAEWAKNLQETLGLDALLRATADQFRERFGLPAPCRFVLVVDQAEELYTRARKAEACRFSELVVMAAHELALTVLASLRADHYGHFQADEELFARSTVIDVPPLREDSLRQVVERPPALLGVCFEDMSMGERVVGSTARQPGALPLLSYLLEDLWKGMQRRGDGVLRWSDYPELVGVRGVLARRAEEFFETCREDDRTHLQRLFTLRLVHVPLEGEVARRRARWEECTDAEWRLVETLAGPDWRLLVTGGTDNNAAAEVAHEVVLRDWERLGRWLDAERTFLAWKAELEGDRREWQRTGRDEGTLLRGARLVEAEAWLARRANDLPLDDREFVEASVQVREREQAVQTRRRRWTIGGSLAAAAAMAVLAMVSFGQWREAESQRHKLDDTLRAYRLMLDIAEQYNIAIPEQYKTAGEPFIETFRRAGQINEDRLPPLERNLRALVEQSTGEDRVRARIKLANTLRFGNRSQEAATEYESAADDASQLGRSDLVFEAWIGVARAHAGGNQEQVAAALENAVAAAGPEPTRKQHYVLADYQAQLLADRGDLEAALISALDAVRLADSNSDRFYAEFDRAEVLWKFVVSCNFRKIIDSQSQYDPGDGWGGCRRAVKAAETAYGQAAGTADSLGWAGLAAQVRKQQDDLGVRLSLIEHASVERESSFFVPHDVRDVLVVGRQTKLEPFVDQKSAPSGSPLTDNPPLVSLVTERAGLFDARRRRTVIENRVGILKDIALRLLDSGHEADAFAVFESMRSRGLSELVAALAEPNVTADHRRWLAALVLIEARASAIQARVTRRTIGENDLSVPEEELRELDEIAHTRRGLLARTDARERFAAAAYQAATLADLQRASAKSGIPVLLYWVTPANVVVWIVGPEGSNVYTVFLPEGVLADRVERVIAAGKKGESQPLDERAARELYLYLIAPFVDRLAGREILIVPQGLLVGLPFEALINPADGKFLVERWSVAYALNATFATRALSAAPWQPRTVTAVADPVIDAQTGETKKIEAVGGLALTTVDSYDLPPEKLGTMLSGADVAHLLLHGQFDGDDPLLSRLAFRSGSVAERGRGMTAADLLAVPWNGTRLVVLDIDDSGQVERRISNELFGFPWALLAGGASNVLVSRWRIVGTSRAAWMGLFYGALVEGKGSAEAAALAMREMISSGLRHPSHWASMQVIGR